MLSTWLIAGEVKCHHLVRWYLPGFSAVRFSPFQASFVRGSPYVQPALKDRELSSTSRREEVVSKDLWPWLKPPL